MSTNLPSKRQNLVSLSRALSFSMAFEVPHSLVYNIMLGMYDSIV